MRKRRFRRGPEPHRGPEPVTFDLSGPVLGDPATPGSKTGSTTARTVRGRDRRGRGLRGPLAPPEVPLGRTRADRFADLMLDAVERLEARWRRELTGVEFAVEAVPPVDSAPDAVEGEEVALSRLYRGGAGHNARIVLYRRPVEARASSQAELAAIVHDLIVERVADLLGVEPDAIDPDFGLG